MERTESRARLDMTKRPLRLIYAMSFIDLLAVGMIFPFLGPYVKSMGYSDTQLGVLSSMYAALQVISGPVVGSWSDIRGRKPVFFVTLIISTICYFTMGLCKTIVPLCIFRLLLGVFKHTQTLSKLLIADLTGNNRQLNTAVYGRCTSFGSMGFVVGPMVGGHLSEYENGFSYICLFTSILFMLNTVLVYFLPDLEPARANRCRDVSTSMMGEMKTIFYDLADVDWTKHWGSFALKFFYILVTTMFFSHQPVYLDEVFKLGKLEVGLVISFVSFVGVITGFTMVPVTRYIYKVDEAASLRSFHIFLLLCICFLGFHTVKNIYIFALLLFPLGVCNAVLRVVTMELVFEKCEDYERGCLTGASDSMMAVGRLMAPVTSGFLADTHVAGVMMYASMFSLLAAGISYHIYVVDKLEERYKRD